MDRAVQALANTELEKREERRLRSQERVKADMVVTRQAAVAVDGKWPEERRGASQEETRKVAPSFIAADGRTPGGKYGGAL
jgi:hypothetical protein